MSNMNSLQNNKNAIEVTKLNKIIRSKSILNNVSFSIPQGSITIFVGDNGAGKTTTIKCLLDLYGFSSGQIKIFGIDSHNANARLNIGYVPEKEDFSNSTMKNFLYRMGELLDLENDEIKAKVSELTTLFEIDHLLKSRTNIKKLSTGQKKKIMIVNAFLSNPKLFIMDEPTDNLDPKMRFKFYELINQYNKKYNSTFFICSHNLDEVGEHANYGIFIDHGKILYNGPIASKSDVIHKYKNLVNNKNE